MSFTISLRQHCPISDEDRDYVGIPVYTINHSLVVGGFLTEEEAATILNDLTNVLKERIREITRKPSLSTDDLKKQLQKSECIHIFIYNKDKIISYERLDND